MRREVRLHDQVRRLAVRQPDPADRRHGRADHDGVAHGRRGRRGQHQDDHQRADRQANHRHAVEDPRGDGDEGGDGQDGGKNQALIAPEQEEREALEQPALRDDRDEQRQAEDKEHRVGVHELVEAGERQQVLPDPLSQAVLRDLEVPRRRRQAGERRDDDHQHAVGQRVLVDLVLERSKEKQPKNRREHLGGEQPHRHRVDAGGDDDGGCSDCAAADEPAARQHHDVCHRPLHPISS